MYVVTVGDCRFVTRTCKREKKKEAPHVQLSLIMLLPLLPTSNDLQSESLHFVLFCSTILIGECATITNQSSGEIVETFSNKIHFNIIETIRIMKTRDKFVGDVVS